jgi:pimeloyl-ACP methyl ester carboxylesterase
MPRAWMRSGAVGVALGLIVAFPAFAYDYPITDPFLATVVGTPPQYRADVPKRIPLRVRRLPAEPGRQIPNVLWYGTRLEYSYARQKGPAPLIYLIAGTGATHYSGKNAILMRAFYGAGFNVIGITSPSHPSFVIAASKTKVPGHLRNDAEDIYRVMQQIRSEIGDRMKVTSTFLSGYSLGGAHAAYVAKLDEERGAFGFEKVLLVNPPLNLYNSISLLDRMLENIPGGVDNFHLFFANVVKRVGAVYKESTSVQFSPELVYQAFEENPPLDEELAAVIGVAFRISSSSMVFTSDLMTDYGFIKPDNMTLRKNTPMSPFLMVGARVGFTDYYHEYFWPFYRDEASSRQAFAREQSLIPLGEWLAGAKHIAVVHNQDDIILETDEIDYFPAIFGERAEIYPHGGHMGNLQQHETLGHILGYFQQ